MQSLSGKVPEAAQTGLQNTYTEQNYFLACSCFPEDDMEVALPNSVVAKFVATVVELAPLNPEIISLKLGVDVKLQYKAGQFINLYKDSSTSRSYSLASVPGIDEHLHFHIRKLPYGLVSHWVHSSLKVGDRVEISEAAGDCFYVADQLRENLLLIATGSGLAPLYGIIRDALAQGHSGKIMLYHGSNSAESVYLYDELKSLSSTRQNFIYRPCISGPRVPQGYFAGRAHEFALQENADLSGWRVYLCGHPEMVLCGKKQAFLSGASMRNIYADPFVTLNKDNIVLSHSN
jgi:ferredoxin-NADP reductase